VADDFAEIIERRIGTIQGFVDSALRAETTRDMTAYSGYAQAALVELKEYLEARMDDGGVAYRHVPAVKAAIGALEDVWESAEGVAVPADPEGVHARVVDLSAAWDAALVQLRGALSSEL
jgi:hypothetical protein